MKHWEQSLKLSSCVWQLQQDSCEAYFRCDNDLSCRDLKEAVDEAPYVPNSKAPPLIRAIIDRKCFPQPVIRMRKIDPGTIIHVCANTTKGAYHCLRLHPICDFGFCLVEVFISLYLSTWRKWEPYSVHVILLSFTAKYRISPMKGAPSPDAAVPLQPIQGKLQTTSHSC